MPNVLLGDKNSIPGVHWVSNPNSKNTRKIDNVLLYGNTSKINDLGWKE